MDEVTSDKMATIHSHHPGVFKETKTPTSVLGGCSDVQEEDMARVKAQAQACWHEAGQMKSLSSAQS